MLLFSGDINICMYILYTLHKQYILHMYNIYYMYNIYKLREISSREGKKEIQITVRFLT